MNQRIEENAKVETVVAKNETPKAEATRPAMTIRVKAGVVGGSSSKSVAVHL